MGTRSLTFVYDEDGRSIISMRNEDSTACYFEVFDQDGVQTNVDLMEEGDE